MNLYSDDFLSQSVTVIQEQLRSRSQQEAINLPMLIELENRSKKRVTLLRWLEAVAKGEIKIEEDLCVKTKGGYPIDEVVSALQKDIRRGNYENACHWARELVISGNSWKLWRRLQVISLEDIGMANPTALHVIRTLQAHAHEMGIATWEGQRAAIAGAFFLANSPKSRLMDELCNYFKYVQDGKIMASNPEIPEYAVDCHTKAGRSKGLAWTKPKGIQHWYGKATVLNSPTPIVKDEKRFLRALEQADGYIRPKEVEDGKTGGVVCQSFDEGPVAGKPVARLTEILRGAWIRGVQGIRGFWSVWRERIASFIKRAVG